MRSAPPLQTRGLRRPERSLFGRDHPLVRALDALSAVARQSLVVAAALAASLIAAAGNAAWAPAAVASAGVVLLALVLLAALLRLRRREQVLALIAAGREDLPLAPVERERGRLLDRRTRSCLAASLESLVVEARNASLMAAPPLFDRLVVAAVADELLEVATLLRGEPSCARGIAQVWCLICDGVQSPLHRGDVAELREELGRIRYLLSAETARPDGRVVVSGESVSVVRGRDENRSHR